MNIFKAAFKMRRAGSQNDVNSGTSSRGLSHPPSMVDTKSKNYLNSLNSTSSHSQPNLSRPLIQSNFDPSVILPSAGLGADPLPQPDECIQKALQLHEKGELEEATELLKIAASQNHPLGLFLLGISLRHGWVNYSPHPFLNLLRAVKSIRSWPSNACSILLKVPSSI